MPLSFFSHLIITICFEIVSISVTINLLGHILFITFSTSGIYLTGGFISLLIILNLATWSSFAVSTDVIVSGGSIAMQGTIRGSWKAQIIVKTEEVWLLSGPSHPRKLQPCFMPHLKCIEPGTVLQQRDYANPCTASPVSSIFIFPTPAFMYFSGSTSELPWKCESILLSAWEVGWEVAHLHLKQQALLSGAQNRPVETGWKSTPARHPGCSSITALHRIVLKGSKWIQRTEWGVTEMHHYHFIPTLRTLKTQLHHWFYQGFHIFSFLELFLSR